MTLGISTLLSRGAHVWNRLSSSYWFVPTVMMVAAAALALAMVWVDLKLVKQPSDTTVWLYTGGAEGARSMLSTVAGSVITVAGVGFSITIVTLTQASSQFGPRLLRTFMRDRGNQAVLGTWVGTFIYGILVLRTVRGGDDGAFVPNASVSVAVLLALASVGALVYFIDHVSSTLQAPNLVAAVSRDLVRVIERVFPEPSDAASAGHQRSADAVVPPDGRAQAVRSTTDGYVQVIDTNTLARLAVTHGLILHVPVRPGDFVRDGDVLARVAHADPLEAHLAPTLRGPFFIGAQATDEQDPEFPIRQLVEVAVRALSPGVNDPFTAIHCVDWLGSALARMARRDDPSPVWRDDDGAIRLVVRTYSFAGALDAAFDQIRQEASRSVSVTMRLIDVLGELGESLRTEPQRDAVRRQVRLTSEVARETIGAQGDRDDLENRVRRAMARLEG